MNTAEAQNRRRGRGFVRMALTQTDFLRFCASAVDSDGVAQAGSGPIRSTITLHREREPYRERFPHLALRGQSDRPS